MNTLIFINFVLLNIALFANSFWFTKALKIKDTKAIPAIFTFFVSQIILIEIFLGIFNIINFLNFSLITYGITALLIIAIRPWKISHKFHLKRPPIIPLIIFIPIFALIIIKTIIGLTHLPLEYDSISYHLPFAVEWLKTGNLKKIYYSAFAGPIGYYPSNHELLTLFFLLPFKSDNLVALVNLIFFPIFTLGTYLTCQNLKISKRISLIFSAFLIYTPLFFYQAGTQLTDIFFATTFILSFYFLTEIYKNLAQKQSITVNSLLLGLNLGLFIGTKYLGLIYAIIPTIAFFVVLIRHKISSKRPTVKPLTLTIISALLTGSFFYIRNWINSGNPLFPIEISIKNWTLFKGYKGMNAHLSGTTLIKNFSLENIHKWSVEFFHSTNFQGILIFVGMAFLAVFIIYSIFKKRNRTTGLTLITITTIYLLLYITAPYSFSKLDANIRYAIPFLITGTLALGYLISPRRLLHSAFAILVTATLIYSFIQNTQTLNFSPTPETTYGDDLELISIIHAAEFLDQYDLTANIAYTGFNSHYHLYGNDLQREADYININNCHECRYIDFAQVENSIRTNPDFTAWLTNLKLSDKKYLVINTEIMKDIPIYEFDWAISHPETFTEIFKESNTHLFEIKHD